MNNHRGSGRRRTIIDVLESRRLMAAGFQIELAFEPSVGADVRAIAQQAANRWQSIITGDVQDVGDGSWGGPVDDIRITLRVASIDGNGGGVAQGRPTHIRSIGKLPIAAELELDSADIASQTAAGVLDELVTHEMGHALGFATIWGQFPGLTSGIGSDGPLFKGANAVREYLALGGIGDGVPLETTGGTGTRDKHWSEARFGSELLTGFITAGSNPISRITIGAMADLGYTVNYGAADAYAIPGVTPPPPPPPPVTTGSLTGRVFVDADRDGTLDATESGASGRTVYLDANGNGALDGGERSTTSDAGGNFRIDSIVAGSYALRQVVPGGQYQTTPANNGPIWVMVPAGGMATGSRFGTATTIVTPPPPTTGTISGRAFADTDRDGNLDSGESGAINRTIYVDANDNAAFDGNEVWTTTDASGNFILSNVPVGQAVIRQVVPSGQYQTRPTDGAASRITVLGGQAVGGLLFGTATPDVSNPPPPTTPVTGTLGGKLWDDRDRDGKQDKGEPNLKGRRVYLDTDNDGTRDADELIVQSDSSGSYRFLSVEAGTYVIRQILPAGWTQTSPKSNAARMATIGTAGQSIVNLHFGSAGPRTAVLGGKLFNDKDRDGKQDKGEGNLRGITVWLDLDNDAAFDKGREPTATTDRDGQYRFRNLAAGDYTVRVALKDGWKQVQPTKNKPRRASLDVGESVVNLHFGLRK